mmetsp:Transcript_3368/g.2241  ORF Transcript_3368/g.2241 Transcript_3368/m.2241 type:complete len:88 (+) Transcript_3368:60-323(+)
MIAQGQCQVIIKDGLEEPTERQLAKDGLKVLHPSDIFGEISMIFGCKRTARVIARKYSNLGKLYRDSFKELSLYFPEINEIIKNRIY